MGCQSLSWLVEVLKKEKGSKINRGMSEKVINVNKNWMLEKEKEIKENERKEKRKEKRESHFPFLLKTWRFSVHSLYNHPWYPLSKKEKGKTKGVDNLILFRNCVYIFNNYSFYFETKFFAFILLPVSYDFPFHKNINTFKSNNNKKERTKKKKGRFNSYHYTLTLKKRNL